MSSADRSGLVSFFMVQPALSTGSPRAARSIAPLSNKRVMVEIGSPSRRERSASFSLISAGMRTNRFRSYRVEVLIVAFGDIVAMLDYIRASGEHRNSNTGDCKSTCRDRL
jgi:hypothetical protein